VSYALQVLPSFASFIRLSLTIFFINKSDENYNLDIFEMATKANEPTKELVN
jgi:hypothetical protein